jgi:hypothetical protein
VIVKETDVARVVKETSAGAEDPNHVASIVGAFIQKQPMVGHYVSAHASDLSLEGTVLALLHASVVARAVEVACGRRLPAIGAAQLDAATRAPALATFAKDEPEIESYLQGNIPADDPTLGGKRRATALKLLRIAALAMLTAARP